MLGWEEVVCPAWLAAPEVCDFGNFVAIGGIAERLPHILVIEWCRGAVIEAEDLIGRQSLPDKSVVGVSSKLGVIGRGHLPVYVDLPSLERGQRCLGISVRDYLGTIQMGETLLEVIWESFAFIRLVGDNGLHLERSGADRGCGDVGNVLLGHDAAVCQCIQEAG